MWVPGARWEAVPAPGYDGAAALTARDPRRAHERCPWKVSGALHADMVKEMAQLLLIERVYFRQLFSFLRISLWECA